MAMTEMARDREITRTQRQRSGHVVREGIMIGLLGAMAVMFAFFIADLVAGVPLRTPGLLGELQELEAERDRLVASVAEAEPTPVRLHPNLPELYRKKVAQLRDALADPLIPGRGRGAAPPTDDQGHGAAG